MGIKFSEFQRGTLTAARTLSGEEKISVVFSGTEAKTQGNVIYLPELNATDEISWQDAEIVRGFADHEIVHRRITDLKTGNRILGSATPEMAQLYNAVEDVRVDKAASEIYWGTKRNITTTVNVVCEMLKEKLDANPALANDITKIGPFALAVAGRVAAGYEIDGYENLMERLDPQDRIIIEDLAAEAATMETGIVGYGKVDKVAAHRGFSQGVELARKANTIFLNREHQKKEEGGGGKGGGRGASHGGGAGDADKSSGDTKRTMDAGDETLDFDMSTALRNMAQTELDPSVKKLNYVKPPRQFDSFVGSNNFERVYKRMNSSFSLKDASEFGLKRYNEAIERAPSVLAVMKARLERVILGMDRADREQCSGGGRLNKRKLVNAYNAEENVFTRRSEDFDMNTAVQIVIDQSGSMSGAKIGLARQSAILVAEALSKCNVPFEIVGFRTIGNRAFVDVFNAMGISSDPKDHPGRETESFPYDRHDAIEMTYFKRFDERLHATRWQVGLCASGGSNCDHESIMYASESLLSRREQRKIMIVLSDGEPAFGTCRMQSDIDQLTKATVKQIEASGIEVFGLGIMDNSVKKFYKNWGVIKDVSELPAALITKLTDMMTAKRLNKKERAA